jgi:hypothetical protein
MKRRLERIDESIARYLSQLETADRHGDAVPEAKVARLKGKIEKLKEEIVRLNAINAEMMKSEDKQISLTDPDARSMATSGKDTGIVGYNVQIAVDTQHHLIVAHEVTNVGTDRHQLANMAEQARDEMDVETLDVVADRGYCDGAEIMACEEAGITVTLPKPMTSGAKAAGRFGKQDFVSEKQDCERNAAKRWHSSHADRLRPLRPVYLGDDLFACQPIVTMLADAGDDFIRGCGCRRGRPHGSGEERFGSAGDRVG